MRAVAVALHRDAPCYRQARRRLVRRSRPRELRPGLSRAGRGRPATIPVVPYPANAVDDGPLAARLLLRRRGRRSRSPSTRSRGSGVERQVFEIALENHGSGARSALARLLLGASGGAAALAGRPARALGRHRRRRSRPLGAVWLLVPVGADRRRPARRRSSSLGDPRAAAARARSMRRSSTARARARRRPARARRRAASSCGRCVSSSRFAPDASKAATASSADRWPRGSPSSSPSRERRLADEEVGVARDLGERVARRRVARVRERRAAVRDPEAVASERVVRDPRSRVDLEPGRRPNGSPSAYSRDVERRLEHRRRARSASPNVAELRRSPPGRQPELGLSVPLARARTCCPRPTARGRPSGRGASA